MMSNETEANGGPVAKLLSGYDPGAERWDEVVFHEGFQMVFSYVSARYPQDPPLVEVAPGVEIKQHYSDPGGWRYVFKLSDWTNTVRLDEDGVHAVLKQVWCPGESTSSTDPDGYRTIAVNGGTRIPDFVRDAMLDHLEIEGFGRPPHLPERDGEYQGQSPKPRVAEGSDE